MKSPAKLFDEFKTVIYKNYGENPGKMLVPVSYTHLRAHET